MKTVWISLSLCALCVGLMAAPAQFILIRHGEKPSVGDGLSKRGFERADALVPFFTVASQNGIYNQPQVIFAQATSKNHASTRPMQTVAPLANALGVELITSYTEGRYEKMIDDIKANSDYDNKTVLICWSHDNLGAMAGYIGVKPAPTYPKKAFDRVWVINMDSVAGKALSFKDLPQQLMYGDSSN